MTNQSWPAPAKLNLFLHIVGRRSDGYHLLQTIFQFIDLVDEIDFKILEENIVRRSTVIEGVAEDDDLIVCAAHKLKEYTGCDKGVDIQLRKLIPFGGGLGGGSSDAATTLVALNQLWQTGLTTDELAGIGLTLGADVPVFIYGHAAWAEGVGEQLTLVEPDESSYLVIYPNCSVSTAMIFNASDLTRDTPAITIRGSLGRECKNDCEIVVRKHYSEVAEALDWLRQFAPARLTGTGSCLFASFDDEQIAKAVKSRLPVSWRGFVVKGLNQSPLLKRLVDEQIHC